MLASIKHYLRRYPHISKAYRSFRWKTYTWSDWMNTYISKKIIHFDTPFGFKMMARNYIANRMMRDGAFETEEAEIIKEHLSTTDVFVDVGANIGLYTCLARSLGKPVVAIEPQPQNLSCLYANLNNNNWGDTEVFPLGLSNRPGLSTLYGASGPSASLVSGWAGYSKRFKRIIPVNTLDTILGDRFLGKKLLIKIDVEGAEYGVLRGALRTIRTSPRPAWFIEIFLREYHPGGMNLDFAATFDLFWQHGYEARTANKEFALVTPDHLKSWVGHECSAVNSFHFLFL